MARSGYPRIWLGVLAYLLSLLGTLLLGIPQTRLYSALPLFGAAVLAVIMSDRVRWPAPFALAAPSISLGRERLIYAAGIGTIGLVLLSANVYKTRNQSDVFGPAGCLWLFCIGALVAWTARWSRQQCLQPRNKLEGNVSVPVTDLTSDATTLPPRRVG